MPACPVREARRAAVEQLGEALRGLVDATVRTEVPIEELAAVGEAARDLAARLRADSRGLHDVPRVDDPATGERWYSPVYGPGNPVAPPVVATHSPDGRAEGRATLGTAHEGPSRLGHGGGGAMPLDHGMAGAVRAAGRGGLTATLTVTYRRPVPLGVPLLVTGEVGSTAGGAAPARAPRVGGG